MKRKISDDIMTSSTSSTGSKWERTNLRLAASSNSSSGGFSTGSASDTADSADSKDAHDYYLCLPTLDSSSTMTVDDPNNDDNHDDAQHQRSRTRQLQHLFELDLYLSSVPQLAASTRQLLQSSSSSTTNSTANNHHNNSNNHKVITSSNSGRVINVLQGEMAHCTPSQADVLVSDDATTCHILGLWSHLSLDYSSSTAHRDQQQQNGGDGKLATVAHIDSPDYEDCIRDAVDLHYRYHSSQLSSSSSSSSKQQQHQTRLNGDDSTIILPVIKLSIHLMGGYNDNDGTSHEITQGVLRALSNISDGYINRQQHHHQPRLQMILQTCAVSSSNDNGSGCPIGRGLALDVSSGKVYLAEVGEDDVESSSSSSSSSLLLDNSTTVVTTSTSAKGPDCLLRQARLWASFIFNNGDNDSNDDDNKRRLQIIHHPNDEYLYISPFYFASHPFPHRMLTLNDALLLQYTSSSPEVEKDNFVRCVRETFRYMNGTSCFHVFKKKKMMNEDDDDDEKDYGLDDWWDDEDYSPRRYRRVGLNGWAAVA